MAFDPPPRVKKQGNEAFHVRVKCRVFGVTCCRQLRRPFRYRRIDSGKGHPEATTLYSSRAELIMAPSGSATRDTPLGQASIAEG
jgi:hypothetical protein